jgi:phospholipid transport system substrate-binding protein
MRNVMMLGVLVWALMVMLPQTVLAQTEASAQNNAAARTYITKLSDDVFAIMNDASLKDDEKGKKLASILHLHVDTDWMAMFVAGKYGRTLTPEQKKTYLHLYHDYLVYNYVPRFKEYSGKSYQILRVLEKGSEVVVQAVLKSGKGTADLRADFRIRKVNNHFKVVDLSGEGVSMITTQRSDFGGLLAQKGWDYFLEKLAAKVDSLKKQEGDLL